MDGQRNLLHRHCSDGWVCCVFPVNKIYLSIFQTSNFYFKLQTLCCTHTKLNKLVRKRNNHTNKIQSKEFPLRKIIQVWTYIVLLHDASQWYIGRAAKNCANDPFQVLNIYKLIHATGYSPCYVFRNWVSALQDDIHYLWVIAGIPKNIGSDVLVQTSVKSIWSWMILMVSHLSC